MVAICVDGGGRVGCLETTEVLDTVVLSRRRGGHDDGYRGRQIEDFMLKDKMADRREGEAGNGGESTGEYREMESVWKSARR